MPDQQQGQHHQGGQRHPVRPEHGLESVLRADRSPQIDYVFRSGAGLMIVMRIEVMAVPRMDVRAERSLATDVRMRRIERHQQHAEVQ